MPKLLIVSIALLLSGALRAEEKKRYECVFGISSEPCENFYKNNKKGASPKKSETVANKKHPINPGEAIYIQNTTDPRYTEAINDLVKRTIRDGYASLIIGLKFTIKNEDKLSSSERIAQKKDLSAITEKVLSQIFKFSPPQDVKRWPSLPFIAITVNPDQLRRLLKCPDVLTIQEDVPMGGTL